MNIPGSPKWFSAMYESHRRRKERECTHTSQCQDRSSRKSQLSEKADASEQLLSEKQPLNEAAGDHPVKATEDE